MTVQIFKTNVRDPLAASHISLLLQRRFPDRKINFDLEDCDKILRVEGHQGPVQEADIRLLVTRYGYHCEALKD